MFIDNAIVVLNILLFLCGLLLSVKIIIGKKEKENSILSVLKSPYAKFLDIPIDFASVLFFCTMLALSIFTYFVYIPEFELLMVVMVTGALLFSLYLTFIQFVTIKKLCFPCLLIALNCTLSFLLFAFFNDHQYVYLLEKYYQILVILHIVGVVLGAGAATVADILVFRFLRDFKITNYETNILEMVSEIVWLGLGLLILSGLGFYMVNHETLNTTVKFLVKVVVVGIILINGFVLNLYITPRLIKLKFGKNTTTLVKRITFSCGAISMTSWYFALVMGALRQDVPLTFLQLLGIYVGLVSFAIIMSQTAHKVMDVLKKFN